MTFELFGYIVAPKKDMKQRLKVRAQRNTLANKVDELQRENERLKQENQYVDVNVADPVPDADSEEGQKQRENYVAQVAKSHELWLRDKLLQMSARVRQELANTDNGERIDRILKGADYLCWELIRWGDKMQREQQANQNEGA